MMSAHNIFTYETYRLTHFPYTENLIIPPENGWNKNQAGFLYHKADPLGSRPYGNQLADIPRYNIPGYLVIRASYIPVMAGAHDDKRYCQYLVDGTFSREDITMIVTSLRKGMGGQFIPNQIGLKQDAAGFVGTQNAMRNPWLGMDDITFYAEKPTPPPFFTENISLETWRWYLQNRMKYDYNEKAEVFRLRDLSPS